MGMVEEVGTYLIAQLSWAIDPSVSPATGNVFYTDLPIQPPEAMALYQLAGQPPKYTLGAQMAWVNPRLRVINRHSTIEGAFSDAKGVFDALKTVTGVLLSGTRYIAIRPTGVPEEMGPDPSNLQRVTCVYDVMKLES